MRFMFPRRRRVPAVGVSVNGLHRFRRAQALVVIGYTLIAALQLGRLSMRPPLQGTAKAKAFWGWLRRKLAGLAGISSRLVPVKRRK